MDLVLNMVAFNCAEGVRSLTPRWLPLTAVRVPR